MKLLNLLVLFCAFTTAMAQPTITYENHALKAGVDNPMTFCSFLDAGVAGNNVTWDFTQLKAIKEFTGHISDAVDANFYMANTELEEFGIRFYYDINENGIEHYGYLSRDGRTRVIYDNPYEKIHYPFVFRDNSKSSFSGEYFSKSKKIGDIAGTGDIEADAWGTIKLPRQY